MKSWRVEVDETKGTSTQATNSPVVLAYFSISWSILLPSQSTKRISPAVEEATLPPEPVSRRSGSVTEKSIGKLVWPVVPETLVGSMVISLRLVQEEEYQAPLASSLVVAAK